jgi:hypothetical protein
MPNRPWAAGICDGPLGPLLAVPATGKRSSTNGHSACRHVQEDAQIGEDAADGPRPGGGETRYCLIAVDPYAFAHAPKSSAGWETWGIGKSGGLLGGQ